MTDSALVSTMNMNDLVKEIKFDKSDLVAIFTSEKERQLMTEQELLIGQEKAYFSNLGNLERDIRALRDIEAVKSFKDVVAKLLKALDLKEKTTKIEYQHDDMFTWYADRQTTLTTMNLGTKSSRFATYVKDIPASAALRKLLKEHQNMSIVRSERQKRLGEIHAELQDIPAIERKVRATIAGVAMKTTIVGQAVQQALIASGFLKPETAQHTLIVEKTSG